MKRFIVIWSAFLLSGVGTVVGQTIHPADFRAALADDSVDGTQVTVEMSPELHSVLDRPQSLNERKVEGFRVNIYNENHQNAGLEARTTLARFQTLFPDIPAEIIKRADSPYWKVTVGNSLSRDEQMMILGRIKEAFPLAFPASAEMLPLRNFLQEPSPAVDNAGEPQENDSGQTLPTLPSSDQN